MHVLSNSSHYTMPSGSNMHADDRVTDRTTLRDSWIQLMYVRVSQNSPSAHADPSTAAARTCILRLVF